MFHGLPQTVNVLCLLTGGYLMLGRHALCERVRGKQNRLVHVTGKNEGFFYIKEGDTIL